MSDTAVDTTSSDSPIGEEFNEAIDSSDADAGEQLDELAKEAALIEDSTLASESEQNHKALALRLHNLSEEIRMLEGKAKRAKSDEKRSEYEQQIDPLRAEMTQLQQELGLGESTPEEVPAQELSGAIAETTEALDELNAAVEEDRPLGAPFMQTLDSPLTPDELKRQKEGILDLLDEIESMEASKKNDAAQWSADIKEAEENLAKMRKSARTGTARRSVQCQWVARRGVKVLVRLDTGAEIDVAAMDLFEAVEEAPQPESDVELLPAKELHIIRLWVDDSDEAGVVLAENPQKARELMGDRWNVFPMKIQYMIIESVDDLRGEVLDEVPVTEEVLDEEQKTWTVEQWIEHLVMRVEVEGVPVLYRVSDPNNAETGHVMIVSAAPVSDVIDYAKHHYNFDEEAQLNVVEITAVDQMTEEDLEVIPEFDDALEEKLRLQTDGQPDEALWTCREWIAAVNVRRCRVCNCTEADCSQCVEKTGEPCHWIDRDLCSACAKPRLWKMWGVDDPSTVDFCLALDETSALQMARDWAPEVETHVEEITSVEALKELDGVDAAPMTIENSARLVMSEQQQQWTVLEWATPRNEEGEACPS